MNTYNLLKMIMLCALLSSIHGCGGCSGDDEGGSPFEPELPPPDVLDTEYVGYLTLHFTNDVMPKFNETAKVDVSIDKQGKMTFKSATLSYETDENDGQIRIRRVGTITIRPNGKWFDNNGEDYFDVKENSTVNETMTIWIWDGTSWMKQADQTFNDTWNGGLAFSLDDAAVGNGSTVGVTTGTGSANWTLGLIAVLPPPR